VPSASIASRTPTRSSPSARVPDSTAAVRHFSSQQSLAGASGATSTRDWCATMNSATNSENTSPSNIASRSNSRKLCPASELESRRIRSTRPLLTIAQRLSSDRFRYSCTNACGARAAAPATPGVRRSRSTPHPSRWIGVRSHTCEIANCFSPAVSPPAGVCGSRP